MAESQRQDLVVFSDRSLISKHLFQANEGHFSILITSTQATQPPWLLNGFIETLVTGTPRSLGSTVSNMDHVRPHPVTIASLVHDESFFTSALQKLKIDSRSYRVIDLLSNFVLKNHGKPVDKILADIVNLFPNEPQSSTIILEQPELLLSLLEGLDSKELRSQLILPLRRRCKLLVVNVSVDYFHYSADDERYNEEPLDQVVELRRFFMNLMYDSIVVLGLRPLDTGFSREVTGKLSISKGGKRLRDISDEDLHVVENELFYLCDKDSVRLFYK